MIKFVTHNVFGEFVQNGMDREKLLSRSLCERIVLLVISLDKVECYSLIDRDLLDDF